MDGHDDGWDSTEGGIGGQGRHAFLFSNQNSLLKGAPVAQWVKRWLTDLADRVRSSLEVKSSQP